MKLLDMLRLKCKYSENWLPLLRDKIGGHIDCPIILVDNWMPFLEDKQVAPVGRQLLAIIEGQNRLPLLGDK